MQIFVKTKTGRTIIVDVEVSETVYGIKDKILLKEDYPIENQTLIYAGRELDDNLTLKQQNVPREATIHLI